DDLGRQHARSPAMIRRTVTGLAMFIVGLLLALTFVNPVLADHQASQLWWGGWTVTCENCNAASDLQTDSTSSYSSPVVFGFSPGSPGSVCCYADAGWWESRHTPTARVATTTLMLSSTLM